jgi:hypothetical protein
MNECKLEGVSTFVNIVGYTCVRVKLYVDVVLRMMYIHLYDCTYTTASGSACTCAVYYVKYASVYASVLFARFALPVAVDVFCVALYLFVSLNCVTLVAVYTSHCVMLALSVLQLKCWCCSAAG